SRASAIYSPSRASVVPPSTAQVAAAEWCGARGEIPEVRAMAARRGGSGLLRETRRLHDLLTGDNGQEG
ncbi:hypothetical protein, partial [Nonomuraea sp. NPDC003201]